MSTQDLDPFIETLVAADCRTPMNRIITVLTNRLRPFLWLFVMLATIAFMAWREWHVWN